MRAYAITIEGNEQSQAGAVALYRSCKEVGNEFELLDFKASTPETVEREMEERGILWTYPWERGGTLACLKLHPYKTTNRLARMACFMSHYRLWEMALKTKEPVLILEDDALFIRKIDPDAVLQRNWLAIGINDPRKATRRAGAYHEAVQAQPHSLCLPPWVDDDHRVPQGLAGASAYIITPLGAETARNTVEEYGAWPNDAILCKQLVPGLGQTKTYYTTLQKTASTLA